MVGSLPARRGVALRESQHEKQRRRRVSRGRSFCVRHKLDRHFLEDSDERGFTTRFFQDKTFGAARKYQNISLQFHNMSDWLFGK
jgi:hypothetical protein